jgi:hypothetical protein
MIESIDIWAVYDHPKDYPDDFVARKFMNQYPSNEIIRTRSLLELRKILESKGLRCIARSEYDDPVIIETWL